MSTIFTFMLRKCVGTLCLVIISNTLVAQPGNDDWADAYEIEIGGNGYGEGTFVGAKTSFEKATKEKQEVFLRSLKLVALNQKTVWYKFTNSRYQSVEIAIRQNDTIIHPQDLGLTVFHATEHYPNLGNRAYEFSLLTRVGATSNNCLRPGEYYVQLCARKNVRDSVWIELSAEASQQRGNLITNPMSGLSSNWNFSGCFSLENSEEARPFSDSLFNRSAYFSFKTPVSFQEVSYQFSGRYFSYTLFEGNPKDSSSWYLVDSFTNSQNKRVDRAFKEICGNTLKTNTSYFFKVLFRDYVHNLRFSGVQFAYIPKNKGSRPDSLVPSVGNLRKTATKRFVDHISCDVNNGTAYLCNQQKKITIDTVGFNANNSAIIDTMNFGTWFRFKVSKPVQCFLNSKSSTYPGIEEVERQKSWLFKGKFGDSNFCELEPIRLHRGNTICLDTGEYTVFTGFFRNTITAEDTSLSGFLGKEIRVYLDFIREEEPNADSAKFDNPRAPKRYENILAGNVNTESIDLESDWIYGPYREFVIDGIETKGHSSFYTFELEKDAFVYLWRLRSGRYTIKMYKGNCADGLNTLGEVQNYVGQYENQPTYKLQKLKKGVYTIIASRNKAELCNPPFAHNVLLRLKATTVETPEPTPCKPKFQFAKTAAQLNGGAPLVCTEPDKSTKITEYLLPSTCLNKVNNRGHQHWYNKENELGLDEQFAYFEFEISEKCFFNFQTPLKFQIVKGAISIDSSIVVRKENIIVEKGSGKYDNCAFKKGKYTIILNGNTDGYWAEIEIGHFFKNEFDNANMAYDFGMLSATNQTAQVSGEFNCKTSFQPSDLLSQKNSWYTFRVNGRGKIILQSTPKTNLVAFEATRGHQQMFDEVKVNKEVDSTYKNLRGIQLEKGQSFYKKDQALRRYYINLGHYGERNTTNTSVLFIPDSLATTQGDFCRNAIAGNINGVGNYTAQEWSLEHTLGEGPNEQFNAQLNRPLQEMRGLKTTWFKLNVQNAAGNELIINNTGPNVIEVKVYAGNCNSMTLLGILNGNGSISMDCITDGDYLFQVYSRLSYEGYVGIDVEIRESNGICPIASGPKIIANFDYTNACKGDSMQLINLSTAGSDIEYHWDFGNGETSVSTNPVVHYKESDPDSVRVLLKALNTVTGQQDSMEEWLFLSLPSAGLISDTSVCESKVKLKIENYYPKKYFYRWHVGSQVIASGVRNYTVNLWPDSVNYIRASSQLKNCVDYDTATVKSIPAYLHHLGQERWSVKCKDQVDSLEIKKAWFASSSIWNDGTLGLKRGVVSTGSYLYTVSLPHCSFTDSIVVNDYELPKYTLDTNMCKGDRVFEFMDIESRGDYRKTQVNSEELGEYLLNDSLIMISWATQDSSCLFTDTFIAPQASQWNYSNRSLAICEGESLKLTAPKTPFNYAWSTGEETPMITVDSAGDYHLLADLNDCRYSLKYSVYEISSPQNLIDTTVCDFNMPLIYKVSDSFATLWSTGETTSSINIIDTGQYWVLASRLNCRFKDSFIIMRDCPPQLYVPNAFSPGSDAVNPLFLAKGTEIENYEMRIFAKNGQLVFFTRNLEKGWNGQVGFQPAPVGNYYYTVTYSVQGESRKQSGTLSLIK